MSARYKALFPLASGGMADVWVGVKISDTGFSKLCAIKTIKKQSASQSEFMTMFRDEALICQGLQHANIVQVLDFTTLTDGVALVMEYVQGINLSDLMSRFRDRSEPMPGPVVAYIGREMAKGLHYVHARRDPLTDKSLEIVHRDISPSNILLSIDGEVKITDFGIAKARVNTTETQVGVVKGKFQYMSPEQFGGKHIDYRTDLYAMGCVLWEALAARRLYLAESDAHLIQLIVSQTQPPDLVSLGFGIDAELASIVEDMMIHDADQRASSASDLINRFSGYLAKAAPDFSAIDLVKFMDMHAAEAMNKSRELVKKSLSEQVSFESVSNTEDSKSNSLKPMVLSLDDSNPSVLGLGAVRSSSVPKKIDSNRVEEGTALRWQANHQDQALRTHQRRQFRRQSRGQSSMRTFAVFTLSGAAFITLILAIAQFGLNIDVKKQGQLLRARAYERIQSMNK